MTPGKNEVIEAPANYNWDFDNVNCIYKSHILMIYSTLSPLRVFLFTIVPNIIQIFADFRNGLLGLKYRLIGTVH